ncbi:hypothetical protein ES332_D03G095500v1 [Gossypium tomentosum]|uniref:Uncharacterized protein n=1 Tax=Gossypium tomentosum TaxID=34277 RepID=A0A5D2LPB3_GOSTO|nr:hypothetical protein ES332_D03G095500v1 [Gossypium tomentosum]
MVTSTVIGPSKHRHSTFGDPNFVENYFKNSRLHFIGTWRNRYRNRFPSLSNGFTKSHSNVSASTQKTPIIHIDMTFRMNYKSVDVYGGLFFCLGGYQEPS